MKSSFLPSCLFSLSFFFLLCGDSLSLLPHISNLQSVLTDRMGRKIEFSDKEVERMAKMHHQEGMATAEIGERFGGVSGWTVRDRLRERGYRIRPSGAAYIERDIPDPWFNADAAYVFGTLIGDTSIAYDEWKGEKTPKGLTLNTSDPEFIFEFSKAIRAAFGIQAKEGAMIRAYSVDLGRSYDRFKWRKETWRVPKQFFDALEEVKVALCQGKFDSDGGVEGKAIVTEVIRKQGLKDLQKIVESLGYKTTLNGPYEQKGENCRDTYRLRTIDCSPNLVRLPRKRKNLIET